MRAVNLLPREDASSRRRLPRTPVLLAGTAPLIAAALVFLGYSLEHAKVVDARANVAVARTELAGLGPSLTAASAGAQLAAERASRLAALKDGVGRRVAWDTVLDQVSRVLPAGVWLTALTAESPTPATAAVAAPPATTTTADGSSSSSSSSSSASSNVVTPTAATPAVFTVSGYASSHADVASALARLALVPSLSNVTLQSTSTVTIGSRQLVQFSLGATMGGTGS